MHLLYFHKAGRGEWQKKKKKRAKQMCVPFIFYLFIKTVYEPVCVCVCVCLLGLYECVCLEPVFPRAN